MKTIFKSNNIISDVLNRVVDCKQCTELSVYGLEKELLEGLYLSVKTAKLTTLDEIREGLLFFLFQNSYHFMQNWSKLQNFKNSADIIVYIRDDSLDQEKLPCKAYDISKFSDQTGYVAFIGKTFELSSEPLDDDFKVLAIVHVYNEKDVMDRLIEHLLSQGLDIYFVDNWSDDGTYEMIYDYSCKNPDRVFLERFPMEGKSDYYKWYDQLARTERIAKETNYDWYIHYDADEIRVTPSCEVTLKEMIYHADALGYNVIENTVIDFKVVDRTNNNIFGCGSYFDFGHRSAHFLQQKTWKRTDDFDLKSSGGHELEREYPRVFPLKILNKHYPFRSFEHAKKKVFKDRKPRFKYENATRGWHGHYDWIHSESDLVNDKAGLIKWSDNINEELFIPLFLGCGIRIDDECYEKDTGRVNSSLIGKKIAVYGAGHNGRRFVDCVEKSADIVIWVDKNYPKRQYYHGYRVYAPKDLFLEEYEYIVITIKNPKVSEEIMLWLQENKVDRKCILCANEMFLQ